MLELSLGTGRRVFFVARLGGRSIFGLGSILGFVLSLLCLDNSVFGLGSILCLGGILALSRILGLNSILSLWWSLDFLSLALFLSLFNPLALITNFARLFWDLKMGKRGLGGKGLLY